MAGNTSESASEGQNSKAKDTVSDAARGWPYDWQSTEGNLDPAEIAAEGSYLLSRALNIRRLIAFVGSGISSAYGRVSWAELATNQIDMLIRLHDCIVGKAKQEKAIELLQEKLGSDDSAKILERICTLRRHGEELIELKENDEYMLGLQMCESFWSSLPDAKLEQFATGGQASSDGTIVLIEGYPSFLSHRTFLRLSGTCRQPELGSAILRHIIKCATINEVPHIESLLNGDVPRPNKEGHPAANVTLGDVLDFGAKAVCTKFGSDKTTDMSRDMADQAHLKAVADRLPNYWWFFSQETIQRITKEIRAGIKKVSGADARYQQLLQKVVDLFELASDEDEKRSFVTPDRHYAVGLALDLLRLIVFGNRKKRWAKEILELELAPEKREAPTSRSQRIDKNMDPLDKLAYRLGIKRFATTNYDLELERFCADIGFAPNSAHEKRHSNHVNERYGPLGARTRDMTLSEGHAAELISFAMGEGNRAIDIVHLHGRATDDDDIVITERDYQLKYVRDDRQSQLFRQGLELTFGSNPILFVGLGMSEGDVLRPLREFAVSESRRNRSLIALRAHTGDVRKDEQFTAQQYTRYGVHIVHFGRSPPSEPNGKSNPWLSDFMKAQGDLKDYLKRILKYRKAVLNIKAKKTFSNLLDIKSSDRGVISIKSHIEGLKVIAEITDELKIFKKNEYVEQGGELIESLFKASLPKAINRIVTSVITSAICAKLDGIHKDWNDWKEDWGASIPDRGDRLVYGVVDQKKSGGGAATTDRIVLARHQVIESGLSERVKEGETSEAFNAVLSALKPSVAGRRIIVASGKTGSGGGHLFSQLCEKLAEPGPSALDYEYDAFLASFSFSTEVESVFLALTRFLRDPKSLTDVPRPSDPLGPKQLKDALKDMDRGRRCIIVLSAFDALFNELGRPKTSAIKTFLDVLFSHEAFAHRAPLDLVILTKPTGYPGYLRDIGPLVELSGDGPLLAALGDTRKANKVAEQIPLEFHLKDLSATDAPNNGAEAIKWLESESLPPHPHGGRPDADVIDGFGGGLSTRRFLMTLVLNIIHDMTEGSPNNDPSTAAKVQLFLDDLRLYQGASERVYSAIFELVLDYWYAIEASDESDPHLKASITNPALQEAIIRHLSIIGMPVEVDVLAGCPGIVERIGGNPEAPEKPIEAACSLLAQRGLIFKVRHRTLPGKNGGKDSEIPRWTVHRQLQLYVYRQLGSQRLTPAESYLFAPSLFAAQATNYPVLNAQSYGFIYRLIDALSSFPTGGAILPEKNDQLSRRLRAALGVARSLFSVGVVARFNDLDGMKVERSPKIGHLQHHRMVVRWMLLLAAQLKPEADSQEWPPFYGEEAVWLLNEAAVFSMAQGVSDDAYGLFRLCIAWRRKLDGKDAIPSLPSPALRRILLNFAECQIDRGRLESATKYALRVLNCEDEEALLHGLAESTLGVVAMIRGNYDQAGEYLEKSISKLQQVGRMRPLCISYIRKADLYRRLAKLDKAQHILVNARAAADASSSADLLHEITISELRLMHSRGMIPSAGDRKKLAEAEQYCDAMDMPKLLTKVYAIRAELLLQQGETILAGYFATKMLRIATLNGLRLRKAVGLDLLSRIHRHQGNRHTADGLSAEAVSLARELDYAWLLSGGSAPVLRAGYKEH